MTSEGKTSKLPRPLPILPDLCSQKRTEADTRGGKDRALSVTVIGKKEQGRFENIERKKWG